MPDSRVPQEAIDRVAQRCGISKARAAIAVRAAEGPIRDQVLVEVREVLDEIGEEWRGFRREYERLGERPAVYRSRDKLEALSLIRERFGLALTEDPEDEGGSR